MKPPSFSKADVAYERFLRFIDGRHLMTIASEKLSEADTRAKLIDPIFRDVLGWTEAEIRRETASTTGFADYILGADFNYLLVEAKRTKPRFSLKVPNKARRLKLGGPHLLADRKLKPALLQARNYAIDLGAQFALLTNGSQFLVFKPYTPGRNWEDGIAILWHDHEDIKANFQDFFELLSRDAVAAGGITQAFEQLEGITTEQYAAVDYVQNPDRELVRNRYWNKMSKVLGPLFADVPGSEAQQLELIEHCYVTTRMSDQADQSLDRLLRDTMPSFLGEAGVKELIPGAAHDAFTDRFENDVKMVRPGTYILTGGVGSGKTTFLRRFAGVVAKSFVRHYCIWLHIDFLSIGNVDSSELDAEVRRYTYRRIREALQSHYPQQIPKTGADVRNLFATEIERARLTLLHGVPENSDQWHAEVNRVVDELYADDAKVSHAILTQLRKRGLRSVVVLDNTDQLGETVQEPFFSSLKKSPTITARSASSRCEKRSFLPRTAAAFSMRSATDVFISARPTWQMF